MGGRQLTQPERNKGVSDEWHCRGIARVQRDLLADGRFLLTAVRQSWY